MDAKIFENLFDGCNTLPDEARAFPNGSSSCSSLSLMLLLLSEYDVEIRRLTSQVAALFPDPFVLPNTLFEGFYLCLGHFDLRVDLPLERLEVLDGWVLERGSDAGDREANPSCKIAVMISSGALEGEFAPNGRFSRIQHAFCPHSLNIKSLRGLPHLSVPLRQYTYLAEEVANYYLSSLI